MTKLFKVAIVLVVFLVVGLLLYWYSPYRIEGKDHYDKIWAHRANSIEKAETASKYFKGIELDLVYDETKNLLDVNHPPAESINLTFNTYLSKVTINQQPYLWLDIKNLNTGNAYLILKKLESVFKKHHYPLSKVLVETVVPESLPIFDRAGFLTSYYLPYGLSLRKPKDLTETISKIKRAIKFQPNLMLSSDYQDYSIVKQYFPKRYKCFWAIERPINTKYSEIRNVLKDSLVKVVLFNFRTLSGDR